MTPTPNEPWFPPLLNPELLPYRLAVLSALAALLLALTAYLRAKTAAEKRKWLSRSRGRETTRSPNFGEKDPPTTPNGA